METTLHTEWTVEDICKGFTYNELEGKGSVWIGRAAHYPTRVSTPLHLQ